MPWLELKQPGSPEEAPGRPRLPWVPQNYPSRGPSSRTVSRSSSATNPEMNSAQALAPRAAHPPAKHPLVLALLVVVAIPAVAGLAFSPHAAEALEPQALEWEGYTHLSYRCRFY